MVMTAAETVDERFPSAALQFTLRKFDCDSDEESIYKTMHSYVFRCYSRRFRRPIAIKLLLTETIPPAVRQKFVSRELMIAKHVDHPHLLAALDVDVHESVVIIATPFCGGGNLFKLLRERKRFSEVEAARIFRQLIEALNYLHKKNVAHRDIKLENILFTDQGDVKLIDYGLAIRLANRRERAKSQCGTRGYMAPSIRSGKPYDPFAADYYACGFVLHALLTGLFPKTISSKSLPLFPSKESFHLVRMLLEPSDDLRWNYDEMIAHSDWIKKFAPVWVLSNHPIAVFEVADWEEEAVEAQ